VSEPESSRDSRDELIGRLRADNERLAAENAELKARLGRLERLISRNSGNSSMPPSADDLPGRTPPKSPKGTAKRRRGKQKGSPGAALERVDHPDRVERVFPDWCAGCGHGLDPLVHQIVSVAARQQIDIPLTCARVTEYRLHELRCGCGRVTRADLPEGVGDVAIGYGPNLATLCVYLLVFQAIPVERCAQLIADLTGAEPSTGFVHGMLERAAVLLEGFETTVKMLIIASNVVHLDETTLRAGPRGVKKYVWVAATGLYTAYFLGGRGRDDLAAFGIGDGFRGYAVHDRYDTYDRGALADAAGHQLCCAHLLRDLADAAECYPDQHWPAQAQRELRALIGAHHRAREAGLTQVPADQRSSHITELRRAVRVGLAAIPRVPGAKAKQNVGRCLLEALRDREADVLRFVFDTAIPPTNNQAERDLRPWKTVQKISGRLQSDTTTKHRLIIRGYISTAAKHGINIMEALRDLITGKPWTPPALVTM
jgi:hypothetical protein